METQELTEKQHKKLGGLYLEILESYCSKNDLRLWMNRPFQIEEKVHSTDGYFLLTIDSSKVYSEELITKSDAETIKVNKVFPESKNKNLQIDVRKLKAIIDKAPQQDCYDTIGEDIECKECDGEGEVEWEYNNWTKEWECPVCDGEGYSVLSEKVKNGKTEIADYLYVDIGSSRFYAHRISRLIDVTLKLKEKKITLTYQEASDKGSMFQIKDLEIILMPCLQDEDQEIITKLEI